MPRWLYSLALRALLPVVLAVFAWRSWRHKEYRFRLRETLAIGLTRRIDQPLWLHASSVGEVQALSGFIQSLRQTHPSRALLVTVATPTGLARARELYASKEITMMSAPWDLPGTVRRFLQATRPCAAVVIETEIWPNRNLQTQAQRIPQLLLSARVSERSVSRYQRVIPRLMQRALRTFSSIGAQTQADAERFERIGALAAQLKVIGNFKFDLPLPSGIAQRGAQLRAQWGAARPVWVAGSTHPDEEDVLLRAHRELHERALRVNAAPPLLVLAPRRPERFAAVALWLEAQGAPFERLSSGADSLSAATQVLLIDVLGELLPCYSAGDIAFVGGTLVPIGGHNVLEPAALAKPVICGPHTFNAPEAALLLEQSDGLIRVTDQASLVGALGEAFTDPQTASERGRRASAVVAANRGATERALELLRDAVPDL
jgi:3-deoxy-D-manno-octulosonic-acid transferase